MTVKLLKFFTPAFILSWLIWIPLMLSHFGVGPFHVREGASKGVCFLGMPARGIA